MVRRLGQRDAARAAFQGAAQLTAPEADRRCLAERIERLAVDGTLGTGSDYTQVQSTSAWPHPPHRTVQ
jgi:hypothetical protein